jgi:hypothetical protein
MATFYMFKMNGCGHCTKFFGRTGTEKGTQYQKLIANKELGKLVSFELITFGVDKSAPNGYKYPPKQFENMIKYAPFFLFEARNGDRRVYNGVRTAKSMSNWIMECIEKGPAKRAPRGPIKRRSTRPVSTKPQTLKNMGSIKFGHCDDEGCFKL